MLTETQKDKIIAAIDWLAENGFRIAVWMFAIEGFMTVFVDIASKLN